MPFLDATELIVSLRPASWRKMIIRPMLLAISQATKNALCSLTAHQVQKRLVCWHNFILSFLHNRV